MRNGLSAAYVQEQDRDPDVRYQVKLEHINLTRDSDEVVMVQHERVKSQIFVDLTRDDY